MKRAAWAIAAGTVLAGCHDASHPLAPDQGIAPRLARAGGQPGEPIPGQYIVVLHEAGAAAGAASAAADGPMLARGLAMAHGGQVRHVFRGAALRGFVAAQMTPAAAAALARDPRVAFVEQDQVMRIDATQTNAPWGLDRVDQRARPLDGSYTYTPTGAGVTAYIIDTGIRFGHTDFGGRAVSGFDAVDGGSADDCNGHGTHVAGSVGGTTYGIAKGVRLVGVRVLGCNGSGSNSGVIAGVDWVTANHVKPAVANMSLGGGASAALDAAVQRSIDMGVTYAIAAGNSGANACNYSPARVGAAITVGATTSADARASYSNYGSCLDVFAPGSSITSAWHTSDGATNTISGTSMASPHVAGVAALYLQGSPGATPAAVAGAITGSATTGVLTGIGTGSPNRLLYAPLTTGGGGGGGGGGGAPCTGCTAYAGSLSGTGDSDQHPNGTYYEAAAGTHRGWLSGPTSADFDLYLYRWNGSSWTIVARGTTATSTESVSYNGSAGYYTWVVRSYTGSGSYTFWLTRP